MSETKANSRSLIPKKTIKNLRIHFQKLKEEKIILYYVTLLNEYHSYILLSSRYVLYSSVPIISNIVL